MLTVNSTINLAGQAVPNIIPAVQGDTGRAIVFTLADFTIPAGSTATYYVQKPSGEAVYNAATIDSNKVTVELTAQALAETGDNYGQVRILNGDDVVTSFDFILLVKPFRGIEAIESTTEMNIFDEAVEQAREEIAEAAEEAKEYISTAIDTTLTIEGKAADAKAAGDMIRAAFATDTASGSVASFSDGADNVPVKSLSVGIEAVQSGSGDPSPTNIREISGWDAVKVYATGSNLCSGIESGCWDAITGEKKPSSNWKRTVAKIGVKGSTKYTISGDYTTLNGNVVFYHADGTVTYRTLASASPDTFTTPATCVRIAADVNKNNTVVYIAEGETATDEAFGTVYDIDLPQTVYGGTMDVTSGVLTVDKVAVDLGSLTWATRYTGTTNKTLSTSLSEYYVVSKDVSDSIAEAYTISWVNGVTGLSNPDVHTVQLYRYGNVSSTRATSLYAVVGVNDTPTGLFVYPLETPQTIQLTPQEVSTLLGDNNIYADAGEVSVVYRADVGLYIDKRLSNA